LIKVPAPEVRHGLSSLGRLTAYAHRLGSTQSYDSIRGAFVRRAVGAWVRFRPRPSLIRRRPKDDSRHWRFAMRQAGFLSMCGRPLAGAILAGGLAFVGSGCCGQPYYCYQTTPCAPATIPSSVQTGPVCDVSTAVVEDGTKVTGGSSRSTTVTGGQTTAPRVVVSEPSSSSPSRFSWRRSEDGSLAATSIRGTTDDASVNK
jgi:hypothetical protein